MKEESFFKTVSLFCRIWGVGTATASKLYLSKYRSIEDIRANIPTWFNSSQRIGLEFFEEFEMKIPREEVKRVSDLVETEAKALAHPRELTVITCGSYRRGR
jgi:hypothetical protein